MANGPAKGRTEWPWPAPVDDGAAKHIIAGTRLPDVALPATRGADVNLARVQERVVIFVYPFTGTPGEADPPGWDDIPGAHGSTAEAEGFRNAVVEYEALGWQIFGVSAQSRAAQRQFAERSGLSFPLLSDSAFRFSDALQLPRFETGGVTYLKRLTLLARNGVIYRCIYPVHPPDRHAADILASFSAPERG